MNESQFRAVTSVLVVAIVLVAVIAVANLTGQLGQMANGDINRDGVVDALDLSIVTTHWTK